MLNLKYKDAKPLVSQSEKDKKWIICNVVAGIFSFVKGAWEFGLICTIMCVAYVFLYRKHKAREEEADKLLDEFADEEDDGKTRSISFLDRKERKKKQKERREEYNNFLRRVEADFDTSDIEADEDYDEFEDEDYDEVDDEEDGFHY